MQTSCGLAPHAKTDADVRDQLRVHLRQQNIFSVRRCDSSDPRDAQNLTSDPKPRSRHRSPRSEPYTAMRWRRIRMRLDAMYRWRTRTPLFPSQQSRRVTHIDCFFQVG